MTLKVAVIGTGAMGRNHVRVYSEIPGVDLVAISDTNQETLDNISQKYSCESS